MQQPPNPTEGGTDYEHPHRRRAARLGDVGADCCRHGSHGRAARAQHHGLAISRTA
ncbi:hypothetical protein M087_0078 [Bacteroides fragilis str. S23 R14]|nr:hypothetical protein M087_0078 [Bacteroides fragilis str. S23 R14]EYE48339.1 hypothetical protein M138_0081 [Bacteroides fragilis str. S23L17]